MSLLGAVAKALREEAGKKIDKFAEEGGKLLGKADACLERVRKGAATKGEEMLKAGDKFVDERVKPALKRAADKVGETVDTHGSVLSREFRVLVESIVRTSDSRDKAATITLKAFDAWLKRNFQTQPGLKKFLSSSASNIKDFDLDASRRPMGIAVFPKAARLAESKGVFLPQRFYIGVDGLMVRTYERNIDGAEKAPKYKRLSEHRASTLDVADNSIKLDELALALDNVVSDPRFIAFKKAQAESKQAAKAQPPVSAKPGKKKN